MTIKAIETRYAGCAFRSRLEARWAVFFDELGIEWEYEPQGFQISNCSYDDHGNQIGPDYIGYLPDFYLPGTKTWVEVKGSAEAFAADEAKLAWAVDYGSPLPHVDYSEGTTSGLLILGPVPRPDRPTAPYLVQHRKGIWTNLAVWRPGGFKVSKLDIYGDASCDHKLTDYPKLTPQQFVDGWYWPDFPISVRRALTAARSARFEHGHSGAVR